MLKRREQNYYAPQIFMNMGLPSSKASLLATGIFGVVRGPKHTRPLPARDFRSQHPP